MTGTQPFPRSIMNWVRSVMARLLPSLRSRQLAGLIYVPLALALVGVYGNYWLAEQSRVQAIHDARLAKVQDSGASLDLALASYFQAVADLGAAEARQQVPGTFDLISIGQARDALGKARIRVRAAIERHAADMQSSRASLDADTASVYESNLLAVQSLVDNPPSIRDIGEPITIFGRLVKSRNDMLKMSGQ